MYVGFEGNGRLLLYAILLFAERIICSFIALSTWRLLVIFGISVLLDPYILSQSWWKNFVPSWIWSKPCNTSAR